MTTIATDGKTIAADGRRTERSFIVDDTTEKIFVRHGRIYAVSGGSAARDALIAWHHAGADPTKVPPVRDEHGWSMLVIDGDGLHSLCNSAPYQEKNPAPEAIGSGADLALAAMLLGKTPAEAVAFAATRDVYTGGAIQVIDIATALGRVDAEVVQTPAERTSAFLDGLIKKRDSIAAMIATVQPLPETLSEAAQS